MKVMTIPFQMEINGEQITEYKINDNGTFLFQIKDIEYSLKKLCETFEIKFTCDSCSIKIVLKNLQQKLKLNKKFLCKSCRNIGDKNPMFGKNHKKETIEYLKIINSGVNNSFYGKKHTKEAKQKQKNAKIGFYSGSKNPMFGKTYFDIWVQKYGLDISLTKLAEKNKKHSEKISGTNNPMYNKSLFDLWNQKYGEVKANELYHNWKKNITNSLNVLYYENDFLKDKISLSLKDRKFSDEHRLKLRLSSINYIKKKLELNGDKMVPHFNIYACQLFDEISAIKNINIQHALNGGEYYISELGYWVDGYDQKNNVVYEYYEKEHRKTLEKDLLRENAIKNYLNCDFVIIHEKKENEYLKTILP